MTNLYWLSEEQMGRPIPYFPKSRGKTRVDDRRVLSGIVFINRNGLRWCDAPAEYGPPKALYNRWKRWSDMGVFAQIMTGLAAETHENKNTKIDATELNAHRIASSLGPKKGGGRLIGQTTGGMNTKLHAVTDTSGRPIHFLVTAGQVSDYTVAAALLSSLPDARRSSSRQSLSPQPSYSGYVSETLGLFTRTAIQTHDFSWQLHVDCSKKITLCFRELAVYSDKVIFDEGNFAIRVGWR